MSNQTSRPTREVQQFLIDQGFDLGVWGADNIWGNATTTAVMAWQERVWLDADGIWGGASDGLAFPPAGSIHGIDYSFARPDPAMLASRGIKHAGRYLYYPKYRDGTGRTSKGITRQEYDDLKGYDIDPWFFYEESADDVINGFDVGRVQAERAEEHRVREGLPELPIHFNWDRQGYDSDVPGMLNGLEGAASVIGLERTGFYGQYSMVKAAFDAGVISFACQTYAWSRGQWDPRATTQQWANGQWGGPVDFNRAMVPEFGQHPVTPPVPPTVTIPRAEAVAMRDALTAWIDGEV